jgi:hypothetical protein
VKGGSNLEPNRYSAARQSQDDHIRPPGIIAQLRRQAPAGIAAISKAHAHFSSMKGAASHTVTRPDYFLR